MRWWILAACLTSGCAARNMASMGEQAASAADWPSAYDHYQAAAARRPGNERFAEQRDQARLKALEQLRAAYTASEQDGDLRSATDHLARASRIESNDWIVDGFDTVIRRRIDQAEQKLAAARPDEAYRLAVETHTWIDDPRLEQSLARTRDAMATTTRQLTGSRSFTRATDLATLIRTLEPEQAPLADQLQQEVDTHWAEDTRRRTSEAVRQGQHGRALVLAGLVTTLSDTAEDAARRDRLRQEFIAREGLVFDIQVRGDVERVRVVRQALAQHAGQTPGVRWDVDARTPTVAGTLSLPSATCTQTSTRQPATHTYVSGVIQVPNPEVVELRERVRLLDADARTARRDWETQRSLLDTARTDLEYARADAAPIRRRLARVRVELDAATREQQTAQQAVDDARQAAREVAQWRARDTQLREQIRALEATLRKRQLALRLATREATQDAPKGEKTTGRPTSRPERPEPTPTPTERPTSEADTGTSGRTTRPTESTSAEEAPLDPVTNATAERDAVLQELNARREQLRSLVAPSALVQRVASELATREATLASQRRPEVARRYHRLNQACTAAEQAVEALVGRVTTEERQAHLIEGRLDQIRGDSHAVRSRIAGLPPTLGQEVVDQYPYEVEQWTRTCQTRADLRARSQPLGNQNETFTFGFETSDDAIRAEPSVGLAGDPLQFPSTDRVLVEHADEATLEALRPAIDGYIRTWYEHNLAAADHATTQEQRTRRLLAAWYAQPNAVPGTLGRHLMDTYQLADVNALAIR